MFFLINPSLKNLAFEILLCYDTDTTTNLLAVADIAASGACDTFGRECSSINFTANFMRPCFASDEYLMVTGTVLKYGKKIAVVEVEIVRPDGKLAFKGTSTLAVFDTAITEDQLKAK